jgi:hypothetical protein
MEMDITDIATITAAASLILRFRLHFNLTRASDTMGHVFSTNTLAVNRLTPKPRFAGKRGNSRTENRYTCHVLRFLCHVFSLYIPGLKAR